MPAGSTSSVRPEDIYARPESEFVARFIGAANVLKGTALDDNHVSFAGVTLQVVGAKLAAGQSAAVAIRQHDIQLAIAPPASPGNAIKATVTRQVFLGANRDYMVETPDGTALRVTTPTETAVEKGREVWLHAAARTLPGAQPINNKRARCRDESFPGGNFLRAALNGSVALALGSVFASPARAAAPPPQAITPELIEAAKKEGKVVFYSSMDLPVGEKLGKAFEAAYPGISVQIERSGSERLFQRIDQEFASNIRAADIINSARTRRTSSPGRRTAG